MTEKKKRRSVYIHTMDGYAAVFIVDHNGSWLSFLSNGHFASELFVPDLKTLRRQQRDVRKTRKRHGLMSDFARYGYKRLWSHR